MPRLEHVIARNLAELRQEKDATQYDVAEMMRVYGFGWQTNRVTQIETLRRPVSLIEVVGLSAVFNVPVTRLLAGNDDIELPSGRTMPLVAVRAHLTEPGSVNLPKPDGQVANPSRDDLRRVAKGVGLDPSALQEVSDRMWGHSFWVERETRLGDVSGLTKRSAQTKRGHVTRQLIADVRTWLVEQDAAGIASLAGKVGPVMETSPSSRPVSKFELYQDKAGKYRFRLKVDEQVVLVSEPYESKGAARDGLDVVASLTAIETSGVAQNG